MLFEEKDELLCKYGILRCTREQLDAIAPGAVLHRKDSPYGSEALVIRSAVPEGMQIIPISIEELFVYMVKEEK